MRTPFETIREQSRWKYIYDALARGEIGDVFTYEELGTLSQLNPHDIQERMMIQGEVATATKNLEKFNKRTVENVEGVGYRIVHPREHLRLAKGHQLKALHQIKKGRHKVIHVDKSHLTQEEIRLAYQADEALCRQEEIMRRESIRTKRFEKISSV